MDSNPSPSPDGNHRASHQSNVASHSINVDNDEESARLLSPSDVAVEEFVTVTTLEQEKKVPVYAWGILVAAMLAVSSAGLVFVLMDDVPPLTLAAWRLQLTGKRFIFFFF